MEAITLDVHYGHLIRILHWCTDQTMTDALEQMNLTAAQGRLMSYIFHKRQPVYPKDLEAGLHLSHPTVSGLLSRMEQKGFVEFQTDPRDRRSKRIVVSPKGLACHERMLAVIAANESRIVEGFTPEEKEQFASFLQRAIDNVHPEDGCRKKEETVK